MLTTKDPAELPEARCWPELSTIEAVCPRCGRPGDAICPHCGAQYLASSCSSDCANRPQQASAQRLVQFARLIMAKRNAKFWWACLLMASGDAAAGGVSMAELGKQFSVTRACVSKTCVAICGLLGIPPSRYMMREEAREVHRNNNRRNIKCNSSPKIKSPRN